MLWTPYARMTPVTTDYTATKYDDLLEVPAVEAAVNTITLPAADQKESIFIHNLSAFVQKVVAASGDTLYGGSLVMPGQLVKYDSNGSDWYAFGSENVSAIASISLTAAQIISLNSVPVTLVPAPGAGRVLIVSGIQMQMTRTGTAFANGGALEFHYTDGSGAKVSADIAAALVTTGGAGVAYAHVAGIEASITPVANAAVILIAASADFITGTGTAKLRVAYRVDNFN